MESKRLECLTPNESAYKGELAKSLMNALPNAFVICNAAPNSMAKRKKMSIFLLLNNLKASKPRIETRFLF